MQNYSHLTTNPFYEIPVKLKTHILIVEDEVDIQQLVSYNLIRAGLNVTCADSGEEAIACLGREKIDCVLLDLMLPGMSGLEVCSAIKKGKGKTDSPIPIIMLTAKGEEEDIVAGLECGADDYITKPLSLEYLEKVVLLKFVNLQIKDLGKI